MWFQKKAIDVICIGSASQDIFFPTDEAVLLQTPEDITAKEKIAFELGGKYRVADRYEAVGGVAANVSCGLARLGYQVAAYSCVGDDEIGRFVLDSFKKEGVETNRITIQPEAKTDLSAIIVMTQNGERTIFHNRDANERLVVSQEKLEHARWFFVSALNGEWQKNLDSILAAQKAFGTKLALNPGQHNIKADPQKIQEALSTVDVLLLNKDEAIELLLYVYPEATKEQLDDEQYLLERLAERGAKVIGMTDGKRGAWAFDGTEYWFCPIHTSTQVIDSTGCGDAFGSGFLAAHIAGLPVAQALQYGIANSGSVIGYYGAIEGLLSKQAMEATLALITPTRLS